MATMARRKLRKSLTVTIWIALPTRKGIGQLSIGFLETDTVENGTTICEMVSNHHLKLTHSLAHLCMITTTNQFSVKKNLTLWITLINYICAFKTVCYILCNLDHYCLWREVPTSRRWCSLSQLNSHFIHSMLNHHVFLRTFCVCCSFENELPKHQGPWLHTWMPSKVKWQAFIIPHLISCPLIQPKLWLRVGRSCIQHFPCPKTCYIEFGPQWTYIECSLFKPPHRLQACIENLLNMESIARKTPNSWPKLRLNLRTAL